MANGEIAPSMPGRPESGDGDNRNDGKKSRVVRVPLSKLEQSKPPTPAATTRIIDILTARQDQEARQNQQRIQEQIEAAHQETSQEKTDKKKKTSSKKKAATGELVKEDDATEQAASSFPSVESTAESTIGEAEPESEPDAPTEEANAEIEADLPESLPIEHELPLAEGAVEVSLEKPTVTEVALSERVQSWNEARQQSPPTAPMSEVGQPSVAEIDEVLATERAEATTPPEVTAERFEDDNHLPVVPTLESWQRPPEQQVSPAAITPAIPSRPRFTPPPVPPSPGRGMPPVDRLPENEPTIPPPTRAMRPDTRPAEVRNSTRDFWPGVFVGAAVEHFRHRGREKRMNKEQDAQKERIDELEAAARRDRLEQNIAENELMRTEADARYREAAQPAEVSPLPSTPLRAEQSPLIPIAVEQSRSQPQRLRPEMPVPAAVPEAEQAEPEAENNPLERRHIETSSWHAIEVDDRTGHVAEDSHITYGEAFAQEQRAERQPQSTSQQVDQEQSSQSGGVQSANGVPTLPQPWQAAPTPPVDPRMMGAPDQPSPEQRQAQRVRNGRPPLVQSGADAALWVGLIVVVIAVVVALSL